MSILLVLLVVAGLASIVAGAYLVSLPLALVVVGVELLASAYVIRYLGVRGEAARRAR
jgi:hypothetical protein